MFALTICVPCIVVCLLVLVFGGVYLHQKKHKVNISDAQMEVVETSTEVSQDTFLTSDETEFVGDEFTEPSAVETKTTIQQTQQMKNVQELDEPESVTEAAVDTTDYSSYSNGTSSANIFNGGFTASDGVYQYFRGDDGYLYQNQIGSNVALCLLKKEIWYINVQGNWIYFSNDTDQCLAHMQTDGSNYQVLYDAPVHEPNVSGKWIYFSTSDALYRMYTDGSNCTKLVSGNIWFLNVTSDKLFFGLIQDERMLCSCNLDGSNLTALIPSGVFDIMVYGNYVYYSYGSDTRYLCAMDLYTRETYQLNSNYTRWINTDGTYLYYTNLEGRTDEGIGYGNSLYRIKLDGTSNQKVYEDTIEGLCIQDGLLHYMNPSQEPKAVSLV